MYRIDEREIPQERWQYGASLANEAAMAPGSRALFACAAHGQFVWAPHQLGGACVTRVAPTASAGVWRSRSEKIKRKVALALYQKALIANVLIAI